MIYDLSKIPDKEAAKVRFEYLLEKESIINLSLKRKKRSVNANNLYWKWLKCLEDETGQPKEDYHDYFKDKYIGVSTKVVFGKTIIKEPTTTNKNTKEFSEYMKSVKHESLHDFNINLPNPDDLGYKEFIDKYFY